MTDLFDRLNARTVQVLPKDWKKDRKCPEDGCGGSAERQKCFFDMGGGCPRHYPDNYDPSPYQQVPDTDCVEAAKRIHDLEVMVVRLYTMMAEIDERTGPGVSDRLEMIRSRASKRYNVLPEREFESLKEVVEKRCGLRG